MHSYGVSQQNNHLHFSVFVTDADNVELCFFDEKGNLITKHRLNADGNRWSLSLNAQKDIYRYAYCITRGKKSIFLADPFATNMNDLAAWRRKKTWPAPVSRVEETPFDWQNDRAPNTPWNKTVIYEAHVKGLTQLLEEIPKTQRGTYLALAHKKIIAHLQSLGITALELLPVHGKSEDFFLHTKGLVNYWGYNTLAYFAPESEYALKDAVTEFKTMVRALHSAGIEVILDVVYNHTGEGGPDAPTVCFRGLAEKVYYRVNDDGAYVDYTACGNTLNTDHPHTQEMVLASLRYWVETMHVDGFRFDLAPTIFREGETVDFTHALHQAIMSDPVLKNVKFIAEPWDIGPNGYQRGRFPEPWREWNDIFRDAARRFWKGEGLARELAHAMTEKTENAIQFVTCHDGFTLHDLVSYEKKHNHANGEENRDGTDHNHSFNCGVEGTSANADVLALRQKQMRNFLFTLFFAQGTPMLRAGDEIAQTQQGNNNAYCQDNEISWIHWTTQDTALLQFLETLMRVRAEVKTTMARYGVSTEIKSDTAFEMFSGNYIFFFNAAPVSKIFSVKNFTLKEILHTARNPHKERISGIILVSPQSAVLCELS
ncbi:MAG TPA: alpha-amylase family glycosyl hydrolase [Turneriella sp.]|nr:alpha-amylase family glycosyl hydrolase [Turneriella sp.]